MIVVKIELWPHGYESKKVEIGRMTITNRGDSDNPKRGNYTVQVMRRGTVDTVQRVGEVLNYARRTYPIWELVARALKSVSHGE
jgi:hypothetical protein